jgi:hypothetical protein
LTLASRRRGSIDDFAEYGLVLLGFHSYVLFTPNTVSPLLKMLPMMRTVGLWCRMRRRKRKRRRIRSIEKGVDQ